jgi:hypothetical protein
MNDWVILIALFLLGISIEIVAAKYIENNKVKVPVIVLTWLIIATVLISIWLLRK